MRTKYCFFFLQIGLKKDKTFKVYAVENISHVPAKKLIEIFKIDLERDPLLLESYRLKRKQYKKFKKYFTKNIGLVNLNVFKYRLRQYGTDDFREIRKLYKTDILE